jgi:hypothetical protein
MLRSHGAERSARPQFFRPPQLDAVRDTTKRVTITAGGNDIYLPNLFAWSCAKDAGALSFAWRSAVCDAKSDADVDRAVQQVGESLTEVGIEAHKRAPNATVAYAWCRILSCQAAHHRRAVRPSTTTVENAYGQDG